MPEEPAATPKPEAVSDPSPAKPAAKAPSRKKAGKVGQTYIWGTGRRKSAVARVRICPGTGKFLVNKRELDAYFCIDKDRKAVRTPLVCTETTKSMDVFVNVGGGGITGQAGAVVLGLARALTKSSSDLEPKLRELNLLRRDPRRVQALEPELSEGHVVAALGQTPHVASVDLTILSPLRL